jgi:DNA-binding response OmpR family regulator
VWSNGHTHAAKDIWRGWRAVSSLDIVSSSAVLLAEPEPESRRYLERQLRDDGFRVLEASWSARALDLAERAAPDIVVTPEVDLCRRLREGEPGRQWDRNVPVILLAEPGADAVARVRALEQGADDVVERHLYLELVARIRALLRRNGVGRADVLEAGNLVVDRRARQVRVGGTPVVLAGREFDLAVQLASEPTRVFTKQELLRDVWGVHTALRTRTVDSHASRLRRKLRRAGGGELVANVWGVGYRLLP